MSDFWMKFLEKQLSNVDLNFGFNEIFSKEKPLLQEHMRFVRMLIC